MYKVKEDGKARPVVPSRSVRPSSTSRARPSSPTPTSFPAVGCFAVDRVAPYLVVELLLLLLAPVLLVMLAPSLTTAPLWALGFAGAAAFFPSPLRAWCPPWPDRHRCC